MNQRLMISAVFASSVILAQEPKSPLPPQTDPVVKTAPDASPLQPVATAPMLARNARQAKSTGSDAAPAAPVRNGTLFDQEQDGTIWARAEGYKAGFTGTSATFVPFLGSDAPVNTPVGFELTRVTVGGEPAAFSDAMPTRNGNRITSNLGALRATYDLRARDLEQSFTFDSLPNRGAIEISIAVATELVAERSGNQFTFRGERGAVTYGAAVAIDANGRRLGLETGWHDHTLVLTVPAGFVAEAALPLVVDPVIGASATVGTPGHAVAATDLAYDDSLGEYVMVWEELFSQADSDLYAQRLDQNRLLLGAQFVVDISTTSWRKPGIACLNLYDRFLVVSEVSVGNVTPFWVGGRRITGGPAAAMFPKFDVSKGGVAGHYPNDSMNPDVGGDPVLIAPTYFTVVCEAGYSNSDHDILLKQVEEDGTLRDAYGTWVDASFAFEHHPRISNSDGVTPGQRFGIVYRRENIGGVTGHLRASTCSWDGQFLVLPGGGRSFAVLPDSLTTDFFAVSSPTDPTRGSDFLAIENQPNGAYGQLMAVGFRANASITVPATNVTPYATTVRGPLAIDSDGVRFACAFDYEYSSAPLDLDLHGMTLAIVGNTLVRQDLTPLGSTYEMETAPSLVALHSGGAGRNAYCAGWSLQDPALPDTVRVIRYNGTGAGGFTVRSTGCGGLTIAPAGTATIGESISFSLAGASGLAGYVVGAPVSMPLGFCPGCTQGANGQTVIGTNLVVPIPLTTSLVGGVVAFQGFSIGVGPCLSQVRLSDTIDVEVQ